MVERGRARPFGRVGQRVADLRRAAGRKRERLTQRELADTLGVHQTTVAAWGDRASAAGRGEPGAAGRSAGQHAGAIRGDGSGGAGRAGLHTEPEAET